MDKFLVSELKSGNSKAFDKIFRDYYENLCRFAFSIVHDEDSAQSLVQHVFVKLWEDRERLPEIERLAPYLTTMVRNHCFNSSNRDKRSIRLAEFPAESASGNTTENELNLNELQEKLVIALDELPERCKLAFELSRFENLPNKEIAERMGITVKGVEALIGRALKALRVALIEFLPSAKDGNLPASLFFMLTQLVRKKKIS
jgi:RNA polymerase sigma-70 factor, ECF subfamily